MNKRIQMHATFHDPILRVPHNPVYYTEITMRLTRANCRDERPPGIANTLNAKTADSDSDHPALPLPIRQSMRSSRAPWLIARTIRRQRKIIGHPEPDDDRSRLGFLRHSRTIPLKARNHQRVRRRGFPLCLGVRCRWRCNIATTLISEKIWPDNNPDLPATNAHLATGIRRRTPRLRGQIRRRHHRPVNSLHIRVRKADVSLDMWRCAGAACLASWGIVFG